MKQSSAYCGQPEILCISSLVGDSRQQGLQLHEWWVVAWSAPATSHGFPLLTALSCEMWRSRPGLSCFVTVTVRQQAVRTMRAELAGIAGSWTGRWEHFPCSNTTACTTTAQWQWTVQWDRDPGAGWQHQWEHLPGSTHCTGWSGDWWQPQLSYFMNNSADVGLASKVGAKCQCPVGAYKI